MSRRIAITVTNDLVQDQRMHRIAHTLHDAGYHVTLIGRVLGRSLDPLPTAYHQRRISCLFEKGVLFYLEYNIRLIWWLLRSDYDIIYAVDLDTLLAGSFVSRVRRRKLIHDAHEYFVEVPELKEASVKKHLWDLIGRWCIPSVDLAFTVNKDLAKILTERYRHRFGVVRSVPWLRQTAQEKKSQSDSPKAIIYQGMLNQGRGLEVAIQAVSALEGICLHIVGEGDLSQELRLLAQRVDNRGNIHFLGWKKPDELNEITKNAWLGLNLLSSDSLNYQYSLANKFFDYMHASVPSINMNFPVYQRYIRSAQVGICIDELSVEALSDALREIMDNQEKYDAMVRACEKAAKVYNWNKESQHLLSLIKSIDDE